MELLEVVVPILAAAALLAIIVPWLPSRSRRSRSARSLLAGTDWGVLVLYVDLTIVAGSLGWWALYHGTFGRVHPDGPSDLVILISGFAACAVAFAAVLLPFNRLIGAILAFGGLALAIAAFASSIGPTDGFRSQWYELAGIGLAITGMFLVARSAHR